jgi:hypothetical protein
MITESLREKNLSDRSLTFRRPARTLPGASGGRGLSLTAPARRVMLHCTIGALGVRPGPAGSASAQGLQGLAGSIGAPKTFAATCDTPGH